jgi:uncharacterized zinc-type alcohol dehydrogenase-like protein
MKLARAMGAEVTLFTTSSKKVEDGFSLGASEVVISTDSTQMMKQMGKFSFILDTVSAAHDVNALLGLLKNDGTLCLVGLPPEPIPVAAFSLTRGRKSITGSAFGGTAETQEMIDFCANHNVTAEIELLPIQSVNEAYARLRRADVKYRFVIDMASLVG